MTVNDISSGVFGYGRTATVLEFPWPSLSAMPKAWEGPAIKRLEELIRLKHGWDGYQAVPVSFNTAYFAMQMLESICSDDTEAPQIVPGTNGDLQIEWHDVCGDIELDVRGPNQVFAWRLTPETGPDGQELRLRNDFHAVAIWLKELTEPAIAPIAAAA